MPNLQEEVYKQGWVTKVARNKKWGREESGYKPPINPQQHYLIT